MAESYPEGSRLEDMTSAELDAALDKHIAGEPVIDAERAGADFRLHQFDAAAAPTVSDPDFESTDTVHSAEANK